MQFHEVRFPTDLSLGALGGPERRTEIVTLASGAEERNAPWAHSRRRYDAGLGMRSLDDLEALVAFFEARRGQLVGFRWRDWADWRSCRPSGAVTPFDQPIGEGDGTARAFALVKRYASGGELYVRPIAKPVEGTVRVAVDGAEVAAAADAARGIVTLAEAPPEGAVVTAGFEFDVPVRFDTDRIQVSVAGFEAGEVPSVPVVEIRP